MEYKLTIRTMTLSDLDQVMEIEHASFTVPWSRKDFEDCLKRDHSIYLVADDGGVIAGYCGLYHVLDEGQIENVAVRKEYRGNQIGSLLLSHLFATAGEKGVLDYTLEVRASNASAIRLYQKNGFVDAGVRKGYYTFPKEDAIIMWKYHIKDGNV